MHTIVRHFVRTVATAALLAALPVLPTHATPLTLEVGQATSTELGRFDQLSGSVMWLFAPDALSGVLGSTVSLEVVKPADPIMFPTIAEEPGGPSMPPSFGLSMPVKRLQGELQLAGAGQEAPVALHSVESDGGLLIKPMQGLPGLGSAIYLMNVRVDFTSRGIYGDVYYNVGEHRGVRLMDFASVEGRTDMKWSGDGSVYQGAQLFDITLTQEGQEALTYPGLEEPVFEPRHSMGAMYVSTFAHIEAVPEPSQAMLTGLGLAALGLVLARRQRVA